MFRDHNYFPKPSPTIKICLILCSDINHFSTEFFTESSYSIQMILLLASKQWSFGIGPNLSSFTQGIYINRTLDIFFGTAIITVLTSLHITILWTVEVVRSLRDTRQASVWRTPDVTPEEKITDVVEEENKVNYWDQRLYD